MALNRGFTYREQISSWGAGCTVLDYLSRTYRHSPEAVWKERLAQGELSVDAKLAEPGMRLRAGQWLTWRRPPWDEPDVPLSYVLLHGDRDLLAVSKPSGLPSVPAGGFLEHTLLALVRRDCPEATPIHRLGRGTSGVVLFARTPEARATLCAALRRGEITKIYRALARGIPERERFAIDIPIAPVPHPRLGTVHAASAAGKRALSRVRLLEPRQEASLLEVEIETGRPHQIRIHLAAAGHPLVGDPLYAAGGSLLDAALPGDPGYWLHAERLQLRHPGTGLPITIIAPPPEELRANIPR